MTGWTATDIAAKLADVLGARRRWTSPAAVATAAGLAQRGARTHDTVFARVASRRVAAASPADRKALETALAAVGDDRAVIERALASGAPVGAIAPGKRADLVILDNDQVDFEGLAAPSRLGVALFSGNSNRVRDVYVGGRVVVEAGRHGSEDEARVAFRRALARLRAAP